MKKVLLIGINARYTHSNPALCSLKANAQNLGWQIDLAEFSINQSLTEIKNQITIKEYQAIGFSVYIWNSDLFRILLQNLSLDCPDKIFFAGGPEISYNADYWLEQLPELNFLIVGAGEKAFQTLLAQNFQYPQRLVKIKNPSFKELAFLYSEDDLTNLQGHYLYYEASRGCPFKCAYCLSSRDDLKPDYRSLEQIIQELKIILATKPQIVKFVDRTFNAHKKIAREVWCWLAQQKTETVFHFEVHPEFLNDEDLKILAEVPKGRFQFEIGVQSCFEKSLKAVNRKMNVQQSLANIQKLRDNHNIKIHLDLISTLPYQTMADFAQSFNFVYKLQPEELQLGFLKLLPGTELFEKKQNYNLIFENKPPYIVTETKWLSKKEVDFLHKLEDIFDAAYNSQKFKRTLNYLQSLSQNPFIFYEELTKFILQEGMVVTKRWENLAVIFQAFAREKKGDLDFLEDLLVFDWCFSIRVKHYPPLENFEKNKNLKKLLVKAMMGAPEKFKDLTKEQIKNSLIWQPKSVAFKRQFDESKNKIYCFIINENNKIIKKCIDEI